MAVRCTRNYVNTVHTPPPSQHLIVLQVYVRSEASTQLPRHLIVPPTLDCPPSVRTKRGLYPPPRFHVATPSSHNQAQIYQCLSSTAQQNPRAYFSPGLLCGNKRHLWSPKKHEANRRIWSTAADSSTHSYNKSARVRFSPLECAQKVYRATASDNGAGTIGATK